MLRAYWYVLSWAAFMLVFTAKLQKQATRLVQVIDNNYAGIYLLSLLYRSAWAN
jgi:surface polysaccharide O-acyltransferase-like enzyme